MIIIKKTLRSIPFNIKIYKQKAQKILDALSYSDFDLSILLTSNRTIQKYNKQFRDKDKPTDVLSFPFYPELKAGTRIKAKNQDDKNIGDLIISLPYVYENKHNLEGSFQERMDRMLVHGICHLLGYDHIDDNDFKIMQRLENRLLKLIQS